MCYRFDSMVGHLRAGARCMRCKSCPPADKDFMCGECRETWDKTHSLCIQAPLRQISKCGLRHDHVDDPETGHDVRLTFAARLGMGFRLLSRGDDIDLATRLGGDYAPHPHTKPSRRQRDNWRFVCPPMLEYIGHHRREPAEGGGTGGGRVNPRPTPGAARRRPLAFSDGTPEGRR